MLAIKDFMHKLGKTKQYRDYESAVSLFIEEKSNTADMLKIHILRIDFIHNVLIPFFDNLN
jgi:hypothetical protein